MKITIKDKELTKWIRRYLKKREGISLSELTGVVFPGVQSSIADYLLAYAKKHKLPTITDAAGLTVVTERYFKKRRKR